MPAHIPLFSLFVVAFCLPAFAQDDVDCENPIAQQDMNYCEAQAYEAADADLNVAWREARAAAKETDASLPDDLKGADEALLAGQRGWLAYRDGQCKLSGFEARGGSMEPMLVSGCLRDLTEKRTEELRRYIEGP
jgi:uncharacterized protein YecT (DUF1311 family)